MKLGIDQYTYHRYFGEVYGAHSDPRERWDLPTFLDHIRKLPLEALSLESCFLPDSEETILSALTGLDLDLAFAWGHPNGFMDVDEVTAIEEIAKYLHLSQLCGSRVLRITGSSINYFSEPHGPQIEGVVRMLEKVVPLAEHQGVRLAIENHGDFYLTELREILSRIDSPFLGLTLDTGNLLRLHEDPVEAVCLFGDRLYLVHAKDVALIPGYAEDDPRRLGCVPAGQGIIDFPGFVSALKSASYRGMVLVELSGVHPKYAHVSENEMLRESLAYLKKLLLKNENNETYAR